MKKPQGVQACASEANDLHQVLMLDLQCALHWRGVITIYADGEMKDNGSLNGSETLRCIVTINILKHLVLEVNVSGATGQCSKPNSGPKKPWTVGTIISLCTGFGGKLPTFGFVFCKAVLEGTRLPDIIHFAIGAKVMVMSNINMDMNIANGTCEYGNPSRMGDIPDGVVPIFPKYQLKIGGGKAKSVKWKQLPITGAYGSTDYRAHVIINLTTPPTGALTPFSAYVALSRSSGRKTIRLLRDFDETLFTRPVCEALKWADSQFEELNKKTKEHWEQRCIAGMMAHT
ncbi:uncharacterized protein EI90DRAFT_3289438 [Cantharellus anzutake]|uniref:uncharacterized protein n=1 Tax=Cantharellus anzutake TaxID=1750568 RepID=UPI0019063A03|nr:uncharacterized protein EI90DRAFT_3289438 [Cantharellus anzutake]KAF8331336.1 hypothetical protein EI90DRAFT_3289438 [Cantharellus anzutake]